MLPRPAPRRALSYTGMRPWNRCRQESAIRPRRSCVTVAPETFAAMARASEPVRQVT